jgi:hypothetical protein
VIHHTTPSVDNISTLHHLTSSNPSSIVVGNDSSLSITSVCDSVSPEPFYLNNILLTPDMVQSLLSIHRFTIDNWCSMLAVGSGLAGPQWPWAAGRCAVLAQQAMRATNPRALQAMG